MQQLILVKHSIPDISESVPAKTWKLSEAGRERAHILAKELATYQPAVIFTSSEPKAEETGQIVADALNVTRRTMPDLHEHDRTGEPFGTKAEFEQRVQRFFDQPDTLVYGNESASAAGERFAAAVQTCINQQKQENTVIVAHGTVITLFVALHNPVIEYDLWKRLKMPSYVVLSLPDFQVIEIVETIDGAS